MHSNRWCILLVLAVAAYLLILSSYNLWSYFGIRHLGKAPFADMQAILSASDAYHDGFNPYIENPYDPLGRRHVYTRPWLWLGYIGITRKYNNLAATLLIGLFFLLCIKILNPDNGKEFLICAMLLLSPAVMLGVERANNDLVIFGLLGLSVFLLHKRIRALDWIAYSFLYLASILKIYPLVSFLIVLRTFKDNRKLLAFSLFSMFLLGTYMAFTLSDLQYLKAVVPRPHGISTFGAAILFEWIFNQWPVSSTAVTIMSGLAFFLAFLIAPKIALAERRNDSVHTFFFLVGSLNLLFCFFTNTNYDYRCVYFIMILPWLFELLKCAATPTATKRFINFLLILLPLVVWNEAIISFIMLKLGAPGISKVKMMITINLYVIEHISTWIVMTILLSFCIELFKSPIRDRILAAFRNAPYYSETNKKRELALKN